MSTSFGDHFDEMNKLITDVDSRDKNEAETRHKIIDFVLHDFLSWPKNRVAVEEYISPGFADYILKKENGEDQLFLEAKKEGIFFDLPIAHNADETHSYISIKKLLSDTNIKSAMQQVRTYCFDTGCEYGCITNGHEWIFFKTFEKGKRWEDLKAFVVRSLSFFVNDYTKAINTLSFTAIFDNSSLSPLLSSAQPKDRSIFYPKDKILSYAHPINANRLAPTLRPIANHYFGVISDDDTDFMDKCYVSQREYKTTFDGIHSLIQDSLSPYFKEYGVSQLDDTGKGGKLGGRLTKNLKKGRKGEVLVLFGGKGAGKSTFIKRLLHHTPPRWLKDHSVISIVDLLKIPENKEVIRAHIWKKLVETLDTDNILNSDRDIVIEKLFDDRYQISLKQDLSGLQVNSETFNLKLNQLISDWKKDHLYCATRLVNYWGDQGKGTIVVVDNTDQYSTDIQDFCFTSAQEISNELACVSLISMREERFYDSKIHGVLDAFQNSGFHISSPSPAEVFKKRLSYTISLLADSNRREMIIGDVESAFVQDCQVYLKILSKEFENQASPLTNFISACAHGDTRLSLDLFRSFLLSGYTNVDEMIAVGRWNFQIHQVLKPVMIPTRYFYDEQLSDIPNIYQLRSNRHSSHFTALRILRKLSKGTDSSSPSYHSIAILKSYFSETFNMIDDFEKNVDSLLKHGFVESNNRLDEFSNNVDSIKITNYGLYMSNELAHYFTYLDLICTDTGLFTEKTCNYLTEAARKEYSLFNRGESLDRVKVRLERVEEFIKYLELEEYREKSTFNLDMPLNEMFSYKAMKEFDVEKTRVLKSAMKQKSKKTNGRKR
jgi:GTPase SAR1 family protein